MSVFFLRGEKNHVWTGPKGNHKQCEKRVLRRECGVKAWPWLPVSVLEHQTDCVVLNSRRRSRSGT